MNSSLRQRMTHDLQLAGLSERTWLIALWAGLTYVLRARRAEGPSAPGPAPGCAVCGGALVRLGFVPAASPAPFDTS
jgi:hypothetical protein